MGWGSKGKKSVSLSSTEAEYVAVSEVFKEIIFLRQILYLLGIKVEYPIQIHVDNVGEIFIFKNNGGKRTRHIDIRYHYVREYEEEGIVKVLFVKSKDNVEDIFTKNTDDDTHLKHTSEFMSDFD